MCHHILIFRWDFKWGRFARIATSPIVIALVVHVSTTCSHIQICERKIHAIPNLKYVPVTKAGMYINILWPPETRPQYVNITFKSPTQMCHHILIFCWDFKWGRFFRIATCPSRSSCILQIDIYIYMYICLYITLTYTYIRIYLQIDIYIYIYVYIYRLVLCYCIFVWFVAWLEKSTHSTYTHLFTCVQVHGYLLFFYFSFLSARPQLQTIGI